MRKGLLLLLLPLLAAHSLQASGFSIYEFGGRASAMGGAAVAWAWDGSTVFYNPAGLAYLDGTRIYGGTTLIFPNSRFVGAAPVFSSAMYETRDTFFYPINFYFSHRFTRKFAAGIGVTNPFGLGVEWYDDFSGRGYSKNAQLKSFYISPVVAYQITPNFSIGGGADLVLASVKLEKNVFLFDSPGSPGYEVGEVTLEGNSKLALGFSASAMFRTSRLGWGILYRHSIKNEFKEGEADFTIFDNLTVPNAGALARTLLQDQKANTAIEFPNLIATGIHYKFTDQLALEADYIWFNWSVFNEIALDFANDRLDQTMLEEYRDSWQGRLGLHYQLNDALALRAGYIYDKTPQPIQAVSPLLPDDTRHNFSLGAGYTFGKYQIDAGYMLVLLGKRTTLENGVGRNYHGFDGTYNSRADLLFASFGYTF